MTFIQEKSKMKEWSSKMKNLEKILMVGGHRTLILTDKNLGRFFDILIDLGLVEQRSPTADGIQGLCYEGPLTIILDKEVIGNFEAVLEISKNTVVYPDGQKVIVFGDDDWCQIIS